MKLFSRKNISGVCTKMGLATPPKEGLTEEEREENKDKILAILMQIKDRQGIEELITKLEKDKEGKRFFDIGCNHHHKYPGGLAEHSLEVYFAAMETCKNTPCDSIAIAALLHDLGDIQGGQGHTSVEILEGWNFQLFPNELRAIKYHMWRTHSPEEEAEFQIAKKEELWRSITAGDLLSAGRYKWGKKVFKDAISLWTFIEGKF